MNIKYRNADLQDEEELFVLAEKLATSYKLNKTDFSRIFSELLSNNNVDLVIAETESRLVGYAMSFHHSTFYANGLISWVEELIVLDEYRGMKIGKKLMEIIEEKAHGRGSKLVALATRRASEFYKAIGYDESAIYFKKTLT
ncbi:GNAT family N-acetyltransferase [Paenibacillus harenae]|uniref:GNAT superfamily N-acetyltransferase n=1 Tax=Paenibacillus harenae TaxID=306543 RepID=A0ABT9TZZ8_PAEHA|nr:GNAT family N-acetyltransferase [Paenibacillus harenae]MDQ0112436.1 GNAT superfamily N-acetyltransferase [Paenibacillus harenae]